MGRGTRDIGTLPASPPCPKSAKRNLAGAKITDSRPRNYGSLKKRAKAAIKQRSHAERELALREQFEEFLLKTAPIGCPKFGIVICNFVPPKFRKLKPPEIGKVK